MKIFLNICLAILFMKGTSNAQHVNIGIKAGLNVYNISSSDNSNYDPKLGVHFGLIGHIHRSDYFAIQPEIIFSMQGAKYSAGGLDYKTNLNYINIPVMFQYMFENGFRLEAGPQLGILVSAKNIVNDTDNNIKDQVKTFDFGVGLGVSYVHVSSGFGVDARYNIGLSNINDNGTEKLRNAGIQFGVFYLFNHS